MGIELLQRRGLRGDRVGQDQEIELQRSYRRDLGCERVRRDHLDPLEGLADERAEGPFRSRAAGHQHRLEARPVETKAEGQRQEALVARLDVLDDVTTRIATTLVPDPPLTMADGGAVAAGCRCRW